MSKKKPVVEQEPVTTEQSTTEQAAPETTNPVETAVKPEGAVAKCRRILAELKAAAGPDGVVARADAVAAFVAAGVNVATAKTQFQRLYKQ